MTESVQQAQPDMLARAPRAAFYVDGFNFYHALRDLQQPHVKWLDWVTLARLITNQQNENLVRIVFCTAKPSHLAEDVKDRHQKYVDALRARGVVVKEGWFLGEHVSCREMRCRPPGVWTDHTEKEGDVSLALSVIEDAYEDRFDVGYLVTSDSDQAPTLSLMQTRFGTGSAKSKQMVAVFPMWRGPTAASRKLANFASRTFRISERMLAQSLLPALIKWQQPKGIRLIYRPNEYDPPPPEA